MNKNEIDAYVEAGKIAKEVKIFVCDFVKPGMKLIDIALAIDSKILELGGDFAFPVGLGVNEIAAHFTPDSSCDEVAEGILKIDIGVHVDGYIADTAISIDLTEDKKFADMIKFNEKVLARASEVVRSGMKVCDIGHAVGDFVEEERRDEFAVVKSLCGHSLARNIIHTSPNVSNHRNDNAYVFEDNAFAVEPFVSLGTGEIIEGKGGGIYILKNSRQVRDRDARKVLKFLDERFCGKPFCLRFLVLAIRDGKLDFDEKKLRFVLRNLVKEGVLYEYPILLEESRKPVSQVENTFIISDGKVICTTG